MPNAKVSKYTLANKGRAGKDDDARRFVSSCSSKAPRCRLKSIAKGENTVRSHWKNNSRITYRKSVRKAFDWASYFEGYKTTSRLVFGAFLGKDCLQVQVAIAFRWWLTLNGRENASMSSKSTPQASHIISYMHGCARIVATKHNEIFRYGTKGTRNWNFSIQHPIFGDHKLKLSDK